MNAAEEEYYRVTRYPETYDLLFRSGAAMTLVEALNVMRQAGFLQVKDTHSRFFKDIEEVLPEAKLDLNDYTPKINTGEIVQNHQTPSAQYQCR